MAMKTWQWVALWTYLTLVSGALWHPWTLLVMAGLILVAELWHSRGGA